MRALPLLFTLATLPASANVLTFEATHGVVGERDAKVTFHIQQNGQFEIALNCDGQTFNTYEQTSAGSDIVLDMSQLAKGGHTCSGSVKVLTDNGMDGTLEFQVQVANLPINGLKPGELDLKARRVQIVTERPVTQGQITAMGVGGKIVGSGQADLTDPSKPVFSWDGSEETVKLLVEVMDEYNFPSSLELSPWSYNIPHEDVVFASGSHTIEASEVGKLESTWKDVVDAMNKYNGVIQIQLFVGGYTDTVGDKGSNQALSERRARAIAQWFRQRGFGEPIFYQGFGEEGLAVGTGDEVDNANNRRAQYILAASPPKKSADLPRSNWKAL